MKNPDELLDINYARCGKPLRVRIADIGEARHSASDSIPRVSTRYRCHVCRVALEYQESVKKLVIVRVDDDERPPRKTPRPRQK